MFIEILFKIVLFKGGVFIYAEHCIYISYIYCSGLKNHMTGCCENRSPEGVFIEQ